MLRTVILLLIFPSLVLAEDTIKVHFLYGSKPKRAYQDIESKWFGGVLGGHVGVEKNDEGILHFVPSGAVHLVGQPNNPKSRFLLSAYDEFYQIFGGKINDHKKLIISIPINQEQASIYDSIALAYLSDTPYDYAFKGMRCASAVYNILDHVQLVENRSQHKTSRSVFYPRVLRKILLKKYKENNWSIHKESGSNKRKWDKD